MLLFDGGDHIELGRVDYTNEFLNAMRNWQKYDYSYLKKNAEELLQENYDYIEKQIKKGKKMLKGEDKEYWHMEYLKQIENAKKMDEKRKKAEILLQKKLRSIERVTAIVIDPRSSDNSIRSILLGLKVGHTGYPYIDMEKEVLMFEEYEEGEFYGDKLEEYTELIWRSETFTEQTYLRRISNRPLNLMEWYQKLVNKSFW